MRTAVQLEEWKGSAQKKGKEEWRGTCDINCERPRRQKRGTGKIQRTHRASKPQTPPPPPPLLSLPNSQIGNPQDLACLPSDFHLLLRVPIFLEDVNVRNDVEGEGVGEELVLDRLAFDKAGDARLELVHAWGGDGGRRRGGRVLNASD